MTAVVAVQAQEAVGQDPAAQVGAQLLLDEPGRRLTAGVRSGQEGLELLAHDLVQERVNGGSRHVAPLGPMPLHPDRIGCRWHAEGGCASRQLLPA